MNAKLKLVLGVLAGVIAGFCFIFLNEMLSGKMFPLPSNFDPHDPAQMAHLVSGLPLAANLLVVAGWGVGTFLGALIAARIAGALGTRAALIVGILFWLATLSNLHEVPHPLWMWIAGVALPIPFALLGGRVSAAIGGSK